MSVSSFLHLCCALVYCHLWPFWFYHSFPHHPINGTVFVKNFIEHVMCGVIFSATFETFLILRIIHWDILNVQRSSCKISVILVRFQWNFNFLWQTFGKSSYKISWKSIQWIWIVPCAQSQTDGQMDRRDKANSCFSQLLKCAHKLFC
jgi:hypothetical protein